MSTIEERMGAALVSQADVNEAIEIIARAGRAYDATAFDESPVTAEQWLAEVDRDARGSRTHNLVADLTNWRYWRYAVVFWLGIIFGILATTLPR